MRLNNLIIMGIVSMTMMCTANGAVYGTLKTEIETNIILEDTATTLSKGEVVKIVARQDEAYIIEIDEYIEQEVNLEDVDLIGKLTYTVEADTIIREEALPTADIIKFLKEKEPILVLERQENFYLVRFGSQEGYIYKSQLDETGLEVLPYAKTDYTEASTTQEEVKAQAKAQVKAQSSYIGEEVVAYARQFLGGRYVYGGNSLTKGVDCSGFSQQIMKHFGINIQRSSRAQFASNGTQVSEKELLPGDLVFYGSNGRTIDHVAIYAGNGQIIHASDAKTGIKMSNLHYGKPFIGAKRVLN